MKIEDVRIGNIVGMDALNVYPPNFIAGIRPIILWEINKKDFEPICRFCPIALTEQWLKDFGFKCEVYFEDSRPIYEKDGFYIDFDTLQPIDAGFNIAKVEIKFVHQLQNLHFPITGKELTKK